MRKARFNLDNLMLKLRQKNLPNIHDVEFAILEPNGKLSMIPKSQARPLKPQDLKFNTHYEGMPVMLLEDGNIITDNLIRNGLSKTWLEQELQKRGISDPQKVMIAVLDTNGRLFIGNERTGVSPLKT